MCKYRFHNSRGITNDPQFVNWGWGGDMWDEGVGSLPHKSLFSPIKILKYTKTHTPNTSVMDHG